ncbi:type II toxin-antitoxin system mRNA interferase toxin, RelE/StbE family [Cryptosporangium arvum]|uniref:type II toxin-antitoxin system mRNA interferase toxin, RelE/StbE family n=1 Tax=Cryptosporangium arvum TaxID=80871 RepID=UPI0004AFD4D6|nr:type II toxin-antitoxin system mRNA interferase toxin, RelE/StbE family [Cryptosporangium arvum]
MADIIFTDDALDDLRRIGPDAVPKVLRKILLLADDAEAGYPLGGDLTGFRKLVVGRNTWRVVYRVTADKTIEICEIWAIGARADAEVYREATTRLQRASEAKPHLVPLVQVVDKLGKVANELILEQSPSREPVPDWLAARLIHTVGLPREEVAALDLQQAVDLWTEHMSRPQGS